MIVLAGVLALAVLVVLRDVDTRPAHLTRADRIRAELIR